jgi:hypothetical protein
MYSNMQRSNKKHRVVRKPIEDRGDALSDSIRKELRRTIAIVIYSLVCSRESMTIKDQEDLMFKYFYGTKGDDSVSYLHMFVTGQDIFGEMFEGNPDNGGSKILKSIYSRNSKVLVLGKQIHQTVLELVNLKQGCGEIVGGRYLFESARAGLAGLRKALPFLHQYVDKDTGRILQSGMEMEDVLRGTLDDLHEYETTLKLDKSLKPEEAIAEKKKSEDAEEEDEQEPAVAEALPPGSSVGSQEEEEPDKTINNNDGTTNRKKRAASKDTVPVVTYA